MKLKVGKDTYKAEYYKRRKSWFIRKNTREALYDENDIWLEFGTQGEAEEYLMKLAENFKECKVIK